MNGMVGYWVDMVWHGRELQRSGMVCYHQFNHKVVSKKNGVTEGKQISRGVISMAMAW